MMKRLLALVTLALVALLAVACSGGSDIAADPDQVAHGDDALQGDGDVAAPHDISSDSGAAPQGDGLPDELLPLTRWVDPLVGTGGPGNAFPGPCVPHGMIKPGPDSVVSASSLDGYEWDSDRIEGFAHTHLDGPGGSGYGYGHLLVVPVRGEPTLDAEVYSSAYDRDGQTARPGYYAVTLEDHAVDAELTATAHCTIHRYSAAGDRPLRVVVDTAHSRGRSTGGRVERLDDRTLLGFGSWTIHPTVALLSGGGPGETGHRTLYFHLTVDRPSDESGVIVDGEPVPDGALAEGDLAGGWLGWDAPAAGGAIAPVEVRLCISGISAEQAAAHQAAELDGRSFEDVAGAADLAWNRLLNRVQVEGGDDDLLRTFYTALYRNGLQPVDVTEDGKFWGGWDGEGAVLDARGRRQYVDDFCLWDTFRTTHPLQQLTEPEIRGDVVSSFLRAAEQGGWLPKCTWQGTGYSRIMIGNHAIPVIADAWLNGFRDFDADAAWDAAWRTATTGNASGAQDGLCGFFDLGTVPDYLELGYVSHECDPAQSVSMTLEYAYDDWTLMRFAEALGRTDEAAALAERALSYRNHWDAETGFMRALDRDGEFVEPFDPTANDIDFCEADSWIYSWFAPHDVAGLIELMGGREPFVERLDTYFAGDHHDPSNQPSFHVPYLYLWAGAPSRTQERVRALLASEYRPAPHGLPGNDDAGSTSAWFVFGAMGIYPAAPGSGQYVIGSPLFERVTVNLHPGFNSGATFVIEAPGASADALYVQGATLDGAPLERTWIGHDELARGGVLRLEMGTEPSDWGTAPEAAPHSFSAP